MSDGWSWNVSAEDMRRENSVLHLNGSVEIRTSRGRSEGVEHLLIIRAQQADFYLDSGAIDSPGSITVRTETRAR
jgi:hypothetical protein